MNRNLIIGDITLDIIMDTPSFPIRSGLSVISNNALFEPGGNANTIITACRLGAKVEAAGMVGNDFQGHFVLDALEKEGCGTDLIQKNGTTTIVVTLTDMSGNHSFHGKSGTGAEFDTDVVSALDFDSIANVYLTGYSINDARTEKLCRMVVSSASAKSNIILDPGPEFCMLPEDLKCFFLSKADYFLSTTDEIRALGYKNAEELQFDFPHLFIVEKKGKNGCSAYGADALRIDYRCHPSVNAVDTSGAGDSFAGGFLAALSHGFDFAKAVHFANCVSEVKVSKFGCGRCMPYKKEVLDFIKKENIDI